MSTLPIIFYPKSMPGHLVVEVPDVESGTAMLLVPMRPSVGWSQRAPYREHRDSLVLAPAREGELFLRTAGWREPCACEGACICGGSDTDHAQK